MRLFDTTPDTRKAKNVLLTIRRKPQFLGNLNRTIICMDGVPLAFLKSGEFTIEKVLPGEHIFSILVRDQNVLPTVLRLETHKTYDLEYRFFDTIHNKIFGFWLLLILMGLWCDRIFSRPFQVWYSTIQHTVLMLLPVVLFSAAVDLFRRFRQFGWGAFSCPMLCDICCQGQRIYTSQKSSLSVMESMVFIIGLLAICLGLPILYVYEGFPEGPRVLQHLMTELQALMAFYLFNGSQGSHFRL